jgi:hypothetical protein
MATFASDYSFGTQSELTNHKVIEGFFKTPLERVGGMAIFDFVNKGKTVYADLKTRRIPHNMYPTAIIGGNKIEYAQANPNSDYWFIYQYTDGMYAIQYEKELFDTFEKRDYQRGERSDYNRGSQNCYFIPHEHLKKISQ